MRMHKPNDDYLRNTPLFSVGLPIDRQLRMYDEGWKERWRREE